jgi:hypothetical protein
MFLLFSLCIMLTWSFGVSECQPDETEQTDAQGNTLCMKRLSTVLRSANPECSIEEQSLWINVAAQSNEIFFMNSAYWNVSDATIRNHLRAKDVVIDGSLTLSETSQLNEMTANNIIVNNQIHIDQRQAPGMFSTVPFKIIDADGGIIGEIRNNGGFFGRRYVAQDFNTGDMSYYGYAPEINGMATFMGAKFAYDSTFDSSSVTPIYSQALAMGNPDNYVKSTKETSIMIATRVSIYSKHYVYSNGGFISSSDKRIKKHIMPVPDNLALQKIRNLDAKYYHYVDEIDRGSNRTIGFIAQEVLNVLPEAVSLSQEFVPDEMRMVKVTWSGANMILNEMVKPGTYRFYLSKTPENDQQPVTEIMKDWTTTDGKTFETDGKQFDNVFLYGRQVNDFHIIDKQKIFAVAYAALQQVDKNQQVLQAKVASLESTLADLSQRLAALENQ